MACIFTDLLRIYSDVLMHYLIKSEMPIKVSRSFEVSNPHPILHHRGLSLIQVCFIPWRSAWDTLIAECTCINVSLPCRKDQISWRGFIFPTSLVLFYVIQRETGISLAFRHTQKYNPLI